MKLAQSIATVLDAISTCLDVSHEKNLLTVLDQNPQMC